jgi:diacylglycerol kinase family enzyme
MSKVAVVAHARKSFGGGLPELRTVLAREGVTDPLWYEVKKSRKAPKYARRAVADGADLMFVWGGDGTVQRCIDAVAGTGAVVAILPAGTANLLATNLHVPSGDVTAAVRVGLHGDRRVMDTGTVNGEHFAVMAGAGFDARMIADADRGMKDRLGRAAYVYFPGAQPDDGVLELGVVTAGNPVEWARTLGRVAAGRAKRSPFVEVTAGKAFRIRFDRKLPYELDGGARPGVRDLRIEVHPRSVTICVPA